MRTHEIIQLLKPFKNPFLSHLFPHPFTPWLFAVPNSLSSSVPLVPWVPSVLWPWLLVDLGKVQWACSGGFLVWDLFPKQWMFFPNSFWREKTATKWRGVEGWAGDSWPFGTKQPWGIKGHPDHWRCLKGQEQEVYHSDKHIFKKQDIGKQLHDFYDFRSYPTPQWRNPCSHGTTSCFGLSLWSFSRKGLSLLGRGSGRKLVSKLWSRVMNKNLGEELIMVKEHQFLYPSYQLHLHPSSPKNYHPTLRGTGVTPGSCHKSTGIPYASGRSKNVTHVPAYTFAISHKT